MTKLDTALLGGDEGAVKDLISNLISTANDTYNGRFHLQHLTADEKPGKGILNCLDWTEKRGN